VNLLGVSDLRKNMRIRNRAIVLSLLPIALILWMIGWVLYWKGSHSGEETSKTDKADGFEISVQFPEEEAEYAR
jgi:hypothetical protein